MRLIETPGRPAREVSQSREDLAADRRRMGESVNSIGREKLPGRTGVSGSWSDRPRTQEKGEI